MNTTINELLTMEEIIQRLDPDRVADILAPSSGQIVQVSWATSHCGKRRAKLRGANGKAVSYLSSLGCFPSVALLNGI